MISLKHIVKVYICDKTCFLNKVKRGKKYIWGEPKISLEALSKDLAFWIPPQYKQY